MDDLDLDIRHTVDDAVDEAEMLPNSHRKCLI
jgi:hypothetical protein